MFLCGSVVEHCVSSAKGCGFDSQGTHILMKMYNLNANCKSLWIKASAKCINVNKCRSISFLKNKNKRFRTVLHNYILQLHKHFSLKYTVQIFTSFLWDILKLLWVNKRQNSHGKSGNIRKCSICNSQAWKVMKNWSKYRFFYSFSALEMTLAIIYLFCVQSIKSPIQ